MQNEYVVTGLMSGTSLDGIDLAVCSFRFSSGQWDYSFLYSKTVAYSVKWRDRLAAAHLLEGKDLVILDREYGALLSSVVNEALLESGLHPVLIASHGHTVFHAPEQGYTLQIGSGAEIAAATGIQVVYDFRSLDVALGGHGAPLVPVGDKYLFHEYDACLNLGGFSNISFDSGGKRIAFDICPVNIVLNFLASRQGQLYDEDGMAGRKGNVNPGLLAELDDINYYKKSFPKSLSREWLEKEFIPLLTNTGLNDRDILATLYRSYCKTDSVCFKSAFFFKSNRYRGGCSQQIPY